MGPLGPSRRRGRRQGLIIGAAVGSSIAKKNASQVNAAQSPAQAPAADSSDQITQLQQLAKLKDDGILTQDEFDAKKKQILGL